MGDISQSVPVWKKECPGSATNAPELEPSGLTQTEPFVREIIQQRAKSCNKERPGGSPGRFFIVAWRTTPGELCGTEPGAAPSDGEVVLCPRRSVL